MVEKHQAARRDSLPTMLKSLYHSFSTTTSKFIYGGLYNRTYAIYVRLDYVPQGPRALRAFMSGWARKPKPSIPTAF